MRNDGEKTAKKHRGILQMLRTLMAYSENQLAWVHPHFFLFQHHFFFRFWDQKFGQKCTNTQFIVGDHYWISWTTEKWHHHSCFLEISSWTKQHGRNLWATIFLLVFYVAAGEILPRSRSRYCQCVSVFHMVWTPTFVARFREKDRFTTWSCCNSRGFLIWMVLKMVPRVFGASEFWPQQNQCKKNCPKKVVLDLGTVWCFLGFFAEKHFIFLGGRLDRKCERQDC